MKYTGDGDDATSHSQDDGKVVVVGDPQDEGTVHIRVTDKSNPDDNKVKVFFEGDVALDGTFAIDATLAGESTLKTETFVYVYDLNGNLLQSVRFHTSCSQPLALGDQFGSVKLVGYIGEEGEAVCPLLGGSAGLGDDADEPTGPEIAAGETVFWSYVVTNPGDVQLADVVVTDDNGTPGNSSDDFNPAPVEDGGFNVGDTDQDNRLDVDETWLYTAAAVAQEGV
jgi:hypothetical protein